MKVTVIAAAATLLAIVPATAFAQTVDQLVADHALLNAELDRCKLLGMASVDDAQCETARAAENKRFFGNGTTYTPAPVNIFPNTPDKLVPAQKQPIPTAPSTSGPPNE